MKKKMILFALCFMCVSLTACGIEEENSSVQQNESIAATEIGQTSTQTEAVQPVQTDDIQPDTTNEISLVESESTADALTEEQALDAIKNYCFSNNPDLKNMADSDEYTIYWEVSTNDAGEIVVLYRSYTGAQIRYYIAPVSGETYVTELVPGIIDEEQRTEESLNVREFLS